MSGPATAEHGTVSPPEHAPDTAERGAASQPEHAPPAFTPRWATLLRTRKRDGSWVGTPVNLVVAGGRAYFSTPAETAKVKRLRNFADVEIAPCTPRGKPTGPAVAARARRLDGEDEDAAHRLLRDRHPIVYGVAVPAELRLKRTHGVYYELTLGDPVRSSD